MDAHGRYDRQDLEELKSKSRAEIFVILGSFDERDMTEAAFITAATGLLDHGRVPRLAAALAAGDTTGAAAAVLDACRKDPASTRDQPLPTGVSVHIHDAVADDALEHRFTFYGETHQLGEDFDWDRNPGTAHWGHDLNRCTYLVALTDAYIATSDERYSRKAIDLMLDWIGKCDMQRCFAGTPYMFGSYLNNTIHCSVWARCLQRLLPTETVAPLELLHILKSLHDQSRYLEIVTNGHAGNWPTIGCQGVLATLAALPVFRDLDRLANYCIETLGQQVAQQILPDGVQDELTPHYHAVVVNNILTCAESCVQLGRTLQQRTLDLLRQMVRYQEQTVTPGRRTQVAFNDSDPEAVPRTAERLRRIGLADMIPEARSLQAEAYPWAGVAFLRQPPDEGDLYMAFDGGPFGRSHQHEDKLGFWLHAMGHDFLVDPGRHLYDRSEVSFLPYLVTTQAHSTITIDGAGQHSRGRPDTWIAQSIAPGSGSLSFTQEGSDCRASACYDLGYGPDNAIQVRHHREVVFVGQTFWLLFDTLRGTGTQDSGTHTIESRFQFGPGTIQLHGAQATTQFDDANLLLLTSGVWDEARIRLGEMSPKAGWYSASYNKIEPAPMLEFVRAVALPFITATLLLPYRGKVAPAVTLQLEGDAATVTINDDGWTVAVSPATGISEP